VGEHRGDLVFHLISAHQVAQIGRITPHYYAACGAVVETGTMAPSDCLCEFIGMTYCPDCISAAIEHNRRAGEEKSRT
jgi:hypothetical protein